MFIQTIPPILGGEKKEEQMVKLNMMGYEVNVGEGTQIHFGPSDYTTVVVVETIRFVISDTMFEKAEYIAAMHQFGKGYDDDDAEENKVVKIVDTAKLYPLLFDWLERCLTDPMAKPRIVPLPNMDDVVEFDELIAHWGSTTNKAYALPTSPNDKQYSVIAVTPTVYVNADFPMATIRKQSALLCLDPDFIALVQMSQDNLVEISPNNKKRKMVMDDAEKKALIEALVEKHAIDVLPSWDIVLSTLTYIKKGKPYNLVIDDNITAGFSKIKLVLADDFFVA